MTTNSQVAHIWAQDNNESAKSGNGNFSCENGKLYSYYTVIARFTDGKSGRVILINSESFSKTTTSKHFPALHRAINYGQGQQTFTVPTVTADYPGRGTCLDHNVNLTALARSAADVLTTARICRIGTHTCERINYHTNPTVSGPGVDPVFILSAIKSNELATQYAYEFGLTYDAMTAGVAINEARKIFAEREAAYYTPEMTAKRERDATKRLAAREAKEAREAAERFRKQEERRTAWLAGEPVTFTGRDIDGVSALMRIHGDELQTSMGASVPLSHAVKVFAFVKAVRERGEAWERNGKTIRVGHFTVDRIEPDGSFRAGCHSFRWEEVLRIAALAGVTDIAPSSEAVTSSH